MADEENDALDNWEEQADSGVLDKRLEEMSIDLQNKEEKKKQAPNMDPSGIVVSDDSGRTQYQPRVRILRRETTSPSSQKQNHNSISGTPSPPSSSSKHSKSLQQREAEYAQARLRIFGSPPPDDDEDNEETCDNPVEKSDNIIQNSPQIIKPDPSSPHVAVLRQPRGPDGSSGFKKPDLT